MITDTILLAIIAACLVYQVVVHLTPVLRAGSRQRTALRSKRQVLQRKVKGLFK